MSKGSISSLCRTACICSYASVLMQFVHFSEFRKITHLDVHLYHALSMYCAVVLSIAFGHWDPYQLGTAAWAGGSMAAKPAAEGRSGVWPSDDSNYGSSRTQGEERETKQIRQETPKCVWGGRKSGNKSRKRMTRSCFQSLDQDHGRICQR